MNWFFLVAYILAYSLSLGSLFALFRVLEQISGRRHPWAYLIFGLAVSFGLVRSQVTEPLAAIALSYTTVGVFLTGVGYWYRQLLRVERHMKIASKVPPQLPVVTNDSCLLTNERKILYARLEAARVALVECAKETNE